LAAALRTRDVLPGRMPVERIARFVEGDVVRQPDRQILFRHGNDAARLAVDDRDRATPVSLAGNAPVAQAVVYLALRHRTISARLPFKPLGHVLLRLFDRHTVEEARIDHAAVADISLIGDDEGLRVLPRRAD